MSGLLTLSELEPGKSYLCTLPDGTERVMEYLADAKDEFLDGQYIHLFDDLATVRHLDAADNSTSESRE